MKITDRVPLCLGMICVTSERKYIERSGAKWLFHAGAYRELVTRAANAGAVLFRKLLISPFGKHKVTAEDQFSPYETSDGRFLLSKRNPWYWPIMRSMKAIDVSVGIVGRYDILDGCDFHEGYWNKFVPWINNDKGIKSVYETKAYPYYRELAEEAVAELGADQFYGKNECDNPLAVGLFENVDVPLLLNGTFKPERFCYGAVMVEANFVNPPVMEKGQLTYYPHPVKEGTLGKLKERAGELLGEQPKIQIYRDVHSFGSPPYDAVRKDGIKVHQVQEMWYGPMGKWCSNDGKMLPKTDPRASKCDIDVDGARISGETWAKIIPETLAACPPERQGYKQRVIFETCPQTTDPECIANTILAMSKAVEKAGYGISQNRGKHPWTPANEPDQVFPPPEPDPIPEPEPAQDCSCGNWLKTDGARKPDIWRWIKCIFGGKKRCV